MLQKKYQEKVENLIKMLNIVIILVINNSTIDSSINYYGMISESNWDKLETHHKTQLNSRENNRNLLNKNLITGLEKECKIAKYSLNWSDYTSKIKLDNKQQNLPVLKLPTAKFNMYKYQKSFYKIGQFEKLFLSSKNGIKAHNEH